MDVVPGIFTVLQIQPSKEPGLRNQSVLKRKSNISYRIVGRPFLDDHAISSGTITDAVFANDDANKLDGFQRATDLWRETTHVLADLNRSARSWQTRLIRLKKVAYQRVEPVGLIPLHPMGALIEQVKLGVGNELKEQEAALH